MTEYKEPKNSEWTIGCGRPMTAEEIAAHFTLKQLKHIEKFTGRKKYRAEEHNRILQAIAMLESK